MRLLAPAKINLHLRVGPRRADGFHSLLSWMTTVGLFDNLVLEKTPANNGAEHDRGAESLTAGGLGSGAGSGTDAGEATRGGRSAPVVLLCDLPGLPCDERNLVVRIAVAFAEEARSGSSGVRIDGASGDMPHPARRARGPAKVSGIRATLHKRIPVGAGLGGGSSDAARTLLGLNQLWEAGRAADDLSAFAARFGSDLSFFVHGPSSVCTGRGEVVVPIAPPKARWAVLVLPRLSMPTADVYRRFDAMGLGRDEDLTNVPDWRQWTQLGSEDLLPKLVNDLEPPAFDIAPELGELRSRLERLLKRPVRMSGSGSSLFTLFDSESQAADASARIERETREHAPAVEVSPFIGDDLNEEFANRY